jgi:hypothetical protein
MMITITTLMMVMMMMMMEVMHFFLLTLSFRAEYIYSAAYQATSPAPFKYLFNTYPC